MFRQKGVSIKGADGSRVFSGSRSSGARCLADVDCTAVVAFDSVYDFSRAFFGLWIFGFLKNPFCYTVKAE